MHELRLYYDGNCPLCMKEIRQMQRCNTAGKLELQDINDNDFAERFPHVDRQAADGTLHAELPDGSMLYGVDATVQAWTVVGKGHWFGFLRWPLIRPIADAVYRLFARHRHRISRWVGGPSKRS